MKKCHCRNLFTFLQVHIINMSFTIKGNDELDKLLSDMSREKVRQHKFWHIELLSYFQHFSVRTVIMVDIDKPHIMFTSNVPKCPRKLIRFQPCPLCFGKAFLLVAAR